MKKAKKPTLEQIAAAQQTIKDFFKEYPFGKHCELSFEVSGICGLDEDFGLSENRKKVIMDYLRQGEKVFNAARLLTDPTFLAQHAQSDAPIDKSKVKEIRKALGKLTMPFWANEPAHALIRQRVAHEKFASAMALADADKESLLSTDIGLRFFVRYGLQESLGLLDNLFACYAPFKGLDKARQREIAEFYLSLKELLTAIHLQSTQGWQEQAEEAEGGTHDQ